MTRAYRLVRRVIVSMPRRRYNAYDILPRETGSDFSPKSTRHEKRELREDNFVSKIRAIFPRYLLFARILYSDSHVVFADVRSYP